MPDRENPEPRDVYEQRSSFFSQAAERCNVLTRRLSTARVMTFILFVGLTLWVEERSSQILWSLVGATAVGFFALVWLYRRIRQRGEWLRMLADINAEGTRRLARDWHALPSRGCTLPHTTTHPYAADLDLYGHSSLIQLLWPIGSPIGAAVLDRWLLARADPHIVHARQDAVRELASLHDLRDTFSLHARRTAEGSLADLDRFFLWAEGSPWLTNRRVLLWLIWLLPLATWVFLILQGVGLIDSPLWAFPLALTLALTLSLGNRVRQALRTASSRQNVFDSYSAMLGLILKASFQAHRLRELRDQLHSRNHVADQEMAKLADLYHLADLQPQNLLYFPVQLLTLWDFHVLLALERWQQRGGSEVRAWFSVLGEVEALMALATLAHDHPHWTFPSLAEGGEPVLECESMGHPLLTEAARVDNDVRVGPSGTFLLVTGSNMSGKSTLLRAIGVNIVLAQAGAPVCARRMRLPPVELQTVIRIEDSLAQGVSFFMAELQRLKGVVEAADRLRGKGGPTLFYLFDEILRGTNIAERRIAARHVISHLIRVGAIGVVTTHDLDLADVPNLSGAAELVHFEERIDGDGERIEIMFDYRLRPGLATSTNALALMRSVGLPAG